MPVINRDLSLDELAKLQGLKRRWFGLESDPSLAKRVVFALEQQNPMVQFLDAISNAFEPRHCVSEEYYEVETPPYYLDGGVAFEFQGPKELLMVWTYYYSDDTEEQVIIRRPL